MGWDVQYSFHYIFLSFLFYILISLSFFLLFLVFILNSYQETFGSGDFDLVSKYDAGKEIK